MRAGEDGRSSHIGDKDSNEERGGWIPPREDGEGGDDVIVVSLSTAPSYLSFLALLALFFLVLIK